MNMLAIDSATRMLSVSLLSDDRIFTAPEIPGLRHSEKIMTVIDEAFGAAGIAAADLDAVACMRGPGSFTGIRIGFACAKGIAFALGIPLVSVPTLDAMALPFSAFPGIVIPAIDAKKKSFFACVYRNGEPLCGYMDAEPETIAAEIEKAAKNSGGILITGPDADMFASALGGRFPSIQIDGNYGKSRALIELAKKRLLRDNIIDDGIPLYLRKSDAELSDGQMEG
jgi:tRNA threonylcarbamoyladenosine biosynthesis protein TsaB